MSDATANSTGNSNSPATERRGTLGGRFTFPGTPFTVHRLGYGAMQLSGPGIFGPPRDPETAVAILREAVASGVNHIDTSDYYGPHLTNQIIRQALHPYPAGLVIVTKLGGRRPADGSWQAATSAAELVAATHDNLRNLGLEVLDIVNYRSNGGWPWNCGGVDCGAGYGAGRFAAPGVDPAYRGEQCYGGAGG